ncbi:hypothetical protein [Gordonia malaquae]|uniref:hypothetical protein n=1 Tax=Gordonia malaquae TaxID=410332 RepID=UPI00301792F3
MSSNLDRVQELAAKLANTPYIWGGPGLQSGSSLGPSEAQTPGAAPRPPMDFESMRKIPAEQAELGDFVVTADGEVGIWMSPGKMVRPGPTVVDIDPTSTIRRRD